MKKKILTFLLAVCVSAAVIGCGNGPISNDKITINQYKGLEVEKVDVIEVTDEMIQSSINSTLQTMATETEITDRAVKNGDVVLIDYSGNHNGDIFAGGTAEDQTLEIGSGSFIDGFEEGIIGHVIGDEFDLNLTFPDPYPNNPNLAGEEVIFTVKLKGITERVYPELTEDLVKEISETSTTVEEYKAEVKEALERSNAASAEYTLQESVWEALAKQCTVKKYPEDRKQEIMDNISSQYSYYASFSGMEVDEFVQAQFGLTLEEMAESTIKQEYAVELISKKENIKVSDKDYQEGLEKYAEQFGYSDTEEFETAVGKENLTNVLLQEKVTNWLVENCKQVDGK